MSLQHFPYRTDASIRIARLLKLLNLIRTQNDERPRRIPEMAFQCDCSRATLHRELRFLKREGLISCLRKGVYCLETRGGSLPITSLTAEDALALALARGLLDRPDVPMRSEILAALDRITAVLSAPMRELFQKATSTIRAEPTGGDLGNAPLPVVIESWMHHQTLEMDYDSRSSGRRWRLLDAYQVTAEGGLWMVHGYCHENEKILAFALDRIHEARLTDLTFTRDEDAWKSYEETEGSFLGLRGGDLVTVRVRFSPEVAPYALRTHRWPRTLTATPEPDGSVLLTGTVRGTEGIVVELLRWRRHAHVEGGPELRAAMAAEIAALTALYADEPT